MSSSPSVLELNGKAPGGGGHGWLNELGRWINNSYKPITNTAWVRPRLCK